MLFYREINYGSGLQTFLVSDTSFSEKKFREPPFSEKIFREPPFSEKKKSRSNFE